MTNNKIKHHKEIIMKNITTDKNQNISGLSHLDFQDLPEIALMKSAFPFCKSAKIGNLLYPVIANNNLKDFIVLDENIVAAARKVKRNAFNPSGSEHGIVKKVCDMIINYPSFRDIIRQDLLWGVYYPERIVSDPVFTEKHMKLPRGFEYTMNHIVQTMIMEVVDASRVCDCMMPCAWTKTHNPGTGMMFETIDHIRAQGVKCWFSLNLKSFLDKIPHDRLAEKIHIMFQDNRVADLICTLLGLRDSTTDGTNQTNYVGIPKESPLAAMLGYELYLSEIDQEIMRLGATHVRYNDETVVFCDSFEAAEWIKGTLVAYAKNVMKCPVNHNRTRLKDIAHLAFFGLYLHGGNWRFQYEVKNTAASDYLIAGLAYIKTMDESLLWKAYRNLTTFISVYEDVYDVENEIQQLKKWRDDNFTNAIALVEKIKLGIVKLPE